MPRVGDALLEDVRLLDLGHKAGNGGGELAALQVQSCDVQVACGRVDLRVQRVARDHMR